jgi:hypothetical protein
LFNEFYNKESEGINKVLASFAGVPFTSPDRKLWLTEKKPFDLNEFSLRTPELKDLLYLSKHRGLNEETLGAFIPHILLVKARYKATTDIGFPYYLPDKMKPGTTDRNKIVGFELVNYLFKGHAPGSNKSEGLWIANLNGTGFPPKVFIAESAIDAMSFYQMNKQKYNLDDSTFLSSGGYVTDHQLRNMINAYPHTLIHTLFDNDLSGHLYDIRTACMKDNKNLQIQKTGNKLHFKMDKKSLVLSDHLVSLTNFKKVSGIRPDIRVHKPKGKDFNDILQRRNRDDVKGSIKIR